VTEARAQKVLRWSAVLTLAGLGLMLWSIAAPTALPVVLAMSAGQGLGTLAFALFVWVVVSDLRGKREASPPTTSPPPASPPSSPPPSGEAPQERS
jgi:hypothetical protein